MPERISTLVEQLHSCHYIAQEDLVTTLLIMQQLQRPLLIEGEAGVGKTSIAEALACVHNTELIRIQYYEGIEASSVLYEWNYAQQLLHIKLAESHNQVLSDTDIYAPRFLLERPSFRLNVFEATSH